LIDEQSSGYCGPVSESRSAAGASAGVAAALRERIVAGTLIPGTPLREASLAQEFDVSRNTLREALRQLATESLVDLRRNRGAMVRVLATEDVRDLFRIRRALELRAVDDGAVGSPVALAPISETVAEIEQASAAQDWLGTATASLRFHQALVATLGSARIDDFFATVIASSRLAFAAVAEEASFQRPFAARDRTIHDLLLAGSRASAAASLRRYLDDSEQALIEALQRYGAVESAA
jgi:DNA-binding GntR family transcriptional regulator